MEKNSNTNTIEISIDWYLKNRSVYKQLAAKVHTICKELLEIKGINIHAIFSRVKEIESFTEKIKDPKYNNPKEQITDLAGIRIICYVGSDIPKICKIIEENFDIDNANSSDKSKLLGTDKVGYKSVHYVGKLNKVRLSLPEYQSYSLAKFEIQIRTILQHAWAEIEHDRNYKFSGELPEEIQRRFKLVAGTLELVDNEFDRIATEIDKINIQVEKGTKEGKLDFEINTTTLKQFLLTKFDSLIPDKILPTFVSAQTEARLLQELTKFGLNTLADLNNIIPNDFIQILKKSTKTTYNFNSLLRYLMISSDWENYFENSFDNKWGTIHLKDSDLLTHYKVPVEEIIKKYPYKRS